MSTVILRRSTGIEGWQPSDVPCRPARRAREPGGRRGLLPRSWRPDARGRLRVLRLEQVELCLQDRNGGVHRLIPHYRAQLVLCRDRRFQLCDPVGNERHVMPLA